MIPSRAFSKSLDIDVSSQRHLPGVMSEDVLDHPQERTLSSQVQSVKHSLGAYLDIFLCREAQFNGLVDSPWANESSIKRVFPIRCCYHKDAPAFRCSEPFACETDDAVTRCEPTPSISLRNVDSTRA